MDYLLRGILIGLLFGLPVGAVGAMTVQHTWSSAINGLEGWIECFPKAHLAGTVFAGGVNDAGEIDGHSALAKAYEMGKAV